MLQSMCTSFTQLPAAPLKWSKCHHWSDTVKDLPIKCLGYLSTTVPVQFITSCIMKLDPVTILAIIQLAELNKRKRGNPFVSDCIMWNFLLLSDPPLWPSTSSVVSGRALHLMLIDYSPLCH